MTKSFQKTASILRELQVSHPGIISLKKFDEQFELHCYEPSPDLTPFLVHIWTQRQREDIDSTRMPTEIPSGPNIYLFFTPETAFIHSATTQRFNYNPFTSGVIAGIKFRPGGFHTFVSQSVSQFAAHTPLTSVFPDVDATFIKTLLSQSDEGIVTAIETWLRSKHPEADKNLDLVAKIMDALDKDTSLQTVGNVAKAFDLSERSLQLLFHTYVGTGVKWIVTRRRLLEAIARVQNQDRPSWTEIAAELGYSSQSHFSRDFKKAIGQSPSQYLKELG